MQCNAATFLQNSVNVHFWTVIISKKWKFSTRLSVAPQM
jgi:hypothetical protein